MSDLVRHAPGFSPREAAQIARDLFELTAAADPLPSERDQNFRLEDTAGQRYVLKIANRSESRAVLEFQNQAMTHVAQQAAALFDGNAPCPRVCTAPGGQQILTTDGSPAAGHFVRLLTWLPGRPLATVNPHDADLLFSLGAFFGRLGRALADFDHPGAHRSFHWDLARCGGVLKAHLDEVDNGDRQTLIRRLLDRHDSVTAPVLDGLRCSVIHGDGNDYNVLVSPKGRWGHQVSGVIDFGDMVHSHTVNELAIACAYALMGKHDPLTAAARVIAGYHDALALSDTELSVLFDLIRMRLCTSVCHSARQIRLAPHNTYLLISQQAAWELLFALDRIHPVLAEACFREACGLDPLPRSRRVVSWLQAHQGTFAPVLGALQRPGAAAVVDLSVSTPLLNAGPRQDDADTMTRLIFRELADAGHTIGIGRYDEARLIYTADSFKVETDSAPEYRTVHLGLDLFARPGEAVYAFMPGRVHSLQNNAAEQDYGPTVVLAHEIDSENAFFSLYGHLSRRSLEGLKPGMAIAAGQQIGAIGTSAENGGWAPHLHLQLIVDLLGMTGDFPGVARPSQRRVWRALCPDPAMVLGMAIGRSTAQARDASEILSLRQQHLGRNLSLSYDRPLKIVRGRGVFLYTETGQPYLDGVNNVCHVGHCHPAVVAAGQRQMQVLNTNTRYLHDHIVDYAQRLLATFPEPLQVCFFTCSGSEANELALRLARTYTGRHDLITVAGAYHGNTQGLIDISPYKHDGPGGRGAPAWVQTVAMPCGYRGPHKGSGPETGRAYADYVQSAIARIESRDRQVAAFICESMLGCGGQVLLPDGYLKNAFGHVRRAGGVCIADEVQVGFGRVGSHFWAFETQQVVPDIVTLGKPMGNGHPVAAVVTRPEIAEAFHNGMEYFNTYGGNPVSCAIGMAVLDVIESEGLQENAKVVGAYLLERLRALKAKSTLIGDVRGLGLYVGVELVADHTTLAPAAGQAAYICNRMKDHGFLISTDGPLHNVLKLKPPIVFSTENADALVGALERVLAEDCLQ
jgi:4-aminobutyrate aminotransferase-like enzyme/Ser/Thr protein kinase RdoA (MazF antagonist)